MTIPSPEPKTAASTRDGRSRLAALGVTICSAIIVVTCGTTHEQTQPPAAAPTAASPSAPALALPSATGAAAPPLEAPSPAAEASAEPAPAESAPRARSPGHELAGFYAQLQELEKHVRRAHVRIAWLGDSHGASDFWSGSLRTALQKRFGNGGPGFLHVGNKGYRHDGVKMDFAGTWRPRPKGASTVLPTGDGIFGLGGFMMIGQEQGPRALLAIGTQDPPLSAALTWDLCYKLATPRDEIEVKVNGTLAAAIPAPGEVRGSLRHQIFTSAGANPTFAVTPRAGFPELCGVVVEADPKATPGVVLDTLGINGARLATPLAWNEPSWVAELARRSPALVILEYGTNESGDHTINPAAYTAHLTDVMARVHAASAESDCLVLAPTDRADTLDRTPLVRDALQQAARAVGCGFWDTYAVMGGKGSILAWRAETPPRAGADGVHLSMRGYRELGDKLAADVLAGYTP